MFLEISDATAVVLMILFSTLAGFIVYLLLNSIRKERQRYKEEKSISIEGLLSKSAINSQINTYLSKITPDSNFSLMLLEIQDFDDISNAFGNKEAERALEKAIIKVVHALPKRVIIASYGGTRFLIFLKSEYDRFFAIDLARKVISIVNRPIKIFRETNVNFISNIGVCFYPQHGTKFKHLINSLNIALHNAVKAGGNKYIIYSPNMKVEFNDNVEYHFEIKEAIEKKEFIMQYQPVINISQNDIHGFEAFVRWQHPKYGILSPVQFLNIMEQSGDISWIGVWGLETIIMHNYDLNRDFPDKKYQFTLNLSPRQLMDDKLVDEFGKLIRKYKMTTSKITLEISEYSTYEKNTVIKNNIDRLKKLGFKIAINGFGLDYSTLTSLETMPIDTIRLDKYFFDKEEDTNIKVKLTSLIVDTAKQYEKVVIAEGIETIEMLELVKKAGIELVQGYIYSKPLPVEDVSAFIKRRGWEAEYKEHLKPKVKSQEPLMGHPLAKQKEEAKGKVETEELVSNIEEEKIEEIEVNEDKKDEIEVTEEKNLSLDENKEEKEKDESLFDFDDDNFL